MPDLTITTVQGIGDLLWCYKKLAPLYPKIHFNVLTIDNGCKIQTRADEFLTLLPQYGSHKFTQVGYEDYNRVAALKPTLPDKHGRYWFEYAVNAWLEAGVGLYDIDKTPVLAHVPLAGVKEPESKRNSICVFVAGKKGLNLPNIWEAPQWADVCVLMADRFGATHFDFIGASWDSPETDEVMALLRARGWHCESYCGTLGIAASLNMMRSCQAFIGYQSGLGILAENYDVPQLMVYFDHLLPMMHTWKKPGTTSFHAMTFGQFDLAAEMIGAI